MDKRLAYSGQVPLDLDMLEPQRNVEYALGRILAMTLGNTTVIDGLAVTQQSSPNMTVQVGAGSIATLTTVDPTGVAFGSLALDSANLMKLGINNSPVNMTALVAPATSGQSQNWLVEAQFLEQDTSPVVLPYYDAATPSLPYTGPANAGTSQNTRRTGTVQLQWKAGTAAATGQQNTPTPDAGWVGVAIVTVANGQSSITNSNITAYSSAPFVPTKIPQLRKQLTSDTTIFVSTFGNDTNNSGLSASSPFLSLQRAWNYIVSSLDLNSKNVTVSIANGTYTGGLNASGNVTGLGTGNGVSFIGNTGSPSSVVISTSGAHAIQALGGATISVSGLQLQASGSVGGSGACGIFSTTASTVTLAGPMIFGACAGNQMYATQTGLITSSNGSYTVNGSALAHAATSGGGSIVIIGPTITVSGTLTFSSAFVVAGTLSFVSLAGSAITVTGTVTGARYSVTGNSVVNTSGGGASVFPGNSAGATSTGGQYT